jgi:hypothetical protein
MFAAGSMFLGASRFFPNLCNRARVHSCRYISLEIGLQPLRRASKSKLNFNLAIRQLLRIRHGRNLFFQDRVQHAINK